MLHKGSGSSCRVAALAAALITATAVEADTYTWIGVDGTTTTPYSGDSYVLGSTSTGANWAEGVAPAGETYNELVFNDSPGNDAAGAGEFS